MYSPRINETPSISGVIDPCMFSLVAKDGRDEHFQLTYLEYFMNLFTYAKGRQWIMIAGSHGNSIFSFFFFQERPYCPRQWLHQFTFPPTL